MPELAKLEAYKDANGNEIIYAGSAPAAHIMIRFRGSNNRLVIAPGAKIGKFRMEFDCDNGEVTIGTNDKVGALSVYGRVGQDSRIIIGDNVSTTAPCLMSAVEGTSIEIGNDVMIASENEIKTDDAHPIFDVNTGQRVNVSSSVRIGSHVWLGKRAAVLGGSTIGDGSVIGYAALVKGVVPNNSVAAGVPAKVIRRDIAWERPHLSLAKPFYKPDASTVTHSDYWALTEEDILV